MRTHFHCGNEATGSPGNKNPFVRAWCRAASRWTLNGHDARNRGGTRLREEGECRVEK